MEENESSNVGSSLGIFDTNKAVGDLTPEEAGREWKEMTGSDDPNVLKRYEGMTRSEFLKRRDELWAHGPAKKLKSKETHQQEETNQYLLKESERIRARDEDEILQKVKNFHTQYFGSEKVADEMAERASEVEKQLKEEDRAFLLEYIPGLEKKEFVWGDDPMVTGWLASIRDDPDLIKKVKENGIQHYLNMYSKIFKGVKR